MVYGGLLMQIQIGKGQGITQAIKTALEANGQQVTNNSLSIWQDVMSEVKNAQAENSGEPFYTGGDDVSKIGDKSSWKTDFKVKAGSVIELADNVWNKIVELLTGKQPEVKAKAPEAKAQAESSSTPQAKTQEPQAQQTPQESAINPESKTATTPNQEAISAQNSQVAESPLSPERQTLNQKDAAQDLQAPWHWQGLQAQPAIEPPEINSPPVTYTPPQENIPEGQQLTAQQPAQPINTGDDRSEAYMNAVGYTKNRETAVSNNEYTLENDVQYEKFDKQYKQIDEKMKEFEQKYNFTRVTADMNTMQRRDVLRSQLKMSRDEISAYSELILRYNSYTRNLNSYKEVMSDWGNEQIDAYERSAYEPSINHVVENFTNLKQITLEDGRRAWQTDQGVFLPGVNGYPAMSERVEDENLYKNVIKS